jgi:hypothetical protein
MTKSVVLPHKGVCFGIPTIFPNDGGQFPTSYTFFRIFYIYFLFFGLFINKKLIKNIFRDQKKKLKFYYVGYIIIFNFQFQLFPNSSYFSKKPHYDSSKILMFLPAKAEKAH